MSEPHSRLYFKHGTACGSLPPDTSPYMDGAHPNLNEFAVSVFQLTAFQRTLVWLILCSMVNISFAEDELTLRERDLKQLQSQIGDLQQQLGRNRAEVSEQRQALEETERRLGQLNRQLNDLAQRLSQAVSRRTDLEAEQARLEQQLEGQRDAIAGILRLAYKQNNQPLIKLLLSGERPEDLARQMQYFAILNRQQNDQLQQWIEQSNRLAEVIREQTRLTEQLSRDRDELAKAQTEAATQKNRRAQILVNLQSEAAQTEQSLERKQDEQAQLAQLIERMQAELTDMNLDFPADIDMADVRGGLPWPLDGALRARYDTAQDSSGLKWQGWWLAAATGTDVRAVHHGRVVFSDWLNGFGLLVILDHGDGLMTLYGRNQTLLRTVGEWVKAGDTLAEVGASGGFDESGLYFEVRRNGRPENPANWLENR
ncbi:murein hydrolase activator EnvC [Saccharospirillum sp.]|uniref:murein hydrolase activator EnvC n=1 Tax=Saccharospirillum sp. TaxID=2033801 RepID=UPI0034A05990